MVTKFSDIVYKIIPFFNKYPIEGVKGEYFNNFYKVAEMMKKKTFNSIRFRANSSDKNWDE